MLGLGWEESMLSRYDIHAKGALPPSITHNERKKTTTTGYWIFKVSLERINSKQKYVRFVFLKVIVALILNGYL